MKALIALAIIYVCSTVFAWKLTSCGHWIVAVIIFVLLLIATSVKDRT